MSKLEAVEDKLYPGDWRVEKFENDSYELALFSGDRAKERATAYLEFLKMDIAVTPLPTGAD